MDVRLASFLALVACVMAVFSVRSSLASDDSELTEDRRATWLETRNLEDNFKELVYLSIQELISEGRLSPLIKTSSTEKRARHQGFCFRKTKTGKFLPYICWKGEGEQED